MFVTIVTTGLVVIGSEITSVGHIVALKLSTLNRINGYILGVETATEKWGG